MHFVLNSRIFRTISFQLTALFCLIIAACLLALLFTTYVTTSAALRNQLQTEVRTQLNTFADEAKSDGIETIVQDINERTTANARDAGFYFLSNPAGQKLAGNIIKVTAIDGWMESGVSDQPDTALDTATDDDHQIWGQGVHLADGSYLFVGQDAFRLLTVQESIINSFLWSAAVAFLLAGLAGYLMSKGFLKRIDDINTTSLAIVDGQLKQRIPVRGTSDEIDRLSTNLNRLFDSNQALLESLKQVSANIAHDLRTPLSRLRQGLEEAKANAKNKLAYAEAIDGAIVEADQLLTTFAALLRISQIEFGTRKSGFKNVDLNELLTRVADVYSAVAEDQGKKLTCTAQSDFHFFGDGELLLQMFANLTENAIRHTPEGTDISLSVKETGSSQCVVVADSGPGIPEDQHDKVFEHFFRLESSRTTSGNGLGLALVAAIAKLHGIVVKLEDNKPGLRVLLNFPQPSDGHPK